MNNKENAMNAVEIGKGLQIACQFQLFVQDKRKEKWENKSRKWIS